MRRFLLVSLSILFCFALALTGDTQNRQAGTAKTSVSFDDHRDPVLRAMINELKRSREKMNLGQLPHPYYMEYQVTELQGYQQEATLGALRYEQGNLGRLVRVVVRIGDYQSDSYFGQGVGSIEAMPIDNSDVALRHQLWLATDKAYKGALAGLSEKQAALKKVRVEQEPPDFSQEKPVDAVNDLPKVNVDQGRWKQIVRSTSDLFRRDPNLQSSSAGLHILILNRYFVNTEGTITRNGRSVYELFFEGRALAVDGMRLDRSHAYVVGAAEELPAPLELQKDALQLISTFKALREAPLLEDDYRGPVLFSADAATALFERLIVPNILGNRPELGDPSRVRGEFAADYKSPVLPPFLSVVDDPRPAKISGQTLLGSYDVDDEGVPAVPVTVIDKGVLTNYLLGRQPIKDFLHSNGHGRAAFAAPARPQISNLIFTASNGVPFADLKKRLLQLCKEQGRPYGYYVETTGDRLAPRLLWRVYVNDERMELVRGAALNQLDAKKLRTSIIAAGNDAFVYNRSAPLPTSIVSPSLLIDELEIQRKNSREGLPGYPAPNLYDPGKTP